jgi:ABC-2 type transport system ATP-binding protein
VEEVLSVRDVVKTFGAIRAVDGVSFDVRSGTITGLLGRNGAGKTTTLRMINGIFLPDSGSVRLLGSENGASARDRVGYLPEERGLYRKMKVLEQLLFFAEIKNRPPAEVRGRAEEWLRRFDLWDARDRKLEELSKGNQQKIQIIGTLLHEPELLIFDEPMSGLDPVNVVLVREMLRELRAEGRTILLSTHMMGEAERIVDDIVLIHQGRVVLSGSLDGVRTSLGTNSVHLAFEGDGGFLTGLPGVARAVVQKRTAEIHLASGADAQTVLTAAMARLRVHRFEVAAPSLEEVFIAKVGAAPAVDGEAVP